MNIIKVTFSWLLVLGVLLAGTSAVAKSIGGVYGDRLHIEATPRNATPGVTLGEDDAYIAGTLEVDGEVSLNGANLYTVVPATQTLVAGSTITATACGGVKRITADTAVTTDTTLTFSNPTSYPGCCMLVVNVGTSHITLDTNVLFPGNSNLVLAQYGSLRVCSDGSVWHRGAWTEY